jgi:DNA uptake protein ComE-like DNA-binding protein
MSAVATLRNPPKASADPDLVTNLQERATLLEQSVAAADKASRDLVQAQIQLNSAKAEDLTKLRGVQDELDRLAKAAADVAANPDVTPLP